MLNPETAKAVPLYYHADAGKWYGPNGQDGFCRFKDSHTAALLAEYGFNRSIKDAQGNTVVDRAVLWLMQNRSVSFAGPLAGYKAGYHEFDGNRILVTESPRIITPQSGEWPTIRSLVETMLYDGAHDQVSVFYTWAAESYIAFWQRMTTPGPWQFRHCPALGIFGPRHCGKTALFTATNQTVPPRVVCERKTLFGIRRFPSTRSNSESVNSRPHEFDSTGASFNSAHRCT
jgi:hypothetical protein